MKAIRYVTKSTRDNADYLNFYEDLGSPTPIISIRDDSSLRLGQTMEHSSLLFVEFGGRATLFLPFLTFEEVNHFLAAYDKLEPGFASTIVYAYKE